MSSHPNYNAFDEYSDRWLGKTVRFKFLGEWRTGEVIEALDTICAPMCIVVELGDKNKTAKILMSIHAATRID